MVQNLRACHTSCYHNQIDSVCVQEKITLSSTLQKPLFSLAKISGDLTLASIVKH